MSSSEQERIREVAERVARRLADDPAREESGGDLGALRGTLADIQRRLAHLESHLAEEGECEHDARREERPLRASSPSAPQTPARSMWLSGTYVPATSHPSQEHFNDIGEAVSELVEFFEREKTCTLEPGGKPCDQCGMCSARGF